MNSYKGYEATFEYVPEADVFYGRVANIRDIITFEARDLVQLEHEFHISVDDYLSWCEQDGIEPLRPEPSDSAPTGSSAAAE